MNLFLCKTPIQVLRSIQFAYYEYKDFKNSDLIIFDTFLGSDEMAIRIRKLGVFNEVFIVRNDDFIKGRLNYICALYTYNSLLKIITSKHYSSMTFFNADSYDAFVVFNKLGKNVKVFYVEDAPMLYSYRVPARMKVAIYGLFNKRFPIFHVDRWYFSAPNHMKTNGDGKVYKIPSINRSDKNFRNLINAAFDYSDDDYISDNNVFIMEESFFVDGAVKDNYDYVVYKKIRDRYPNLKISVKLHPRTKVNRFGDEYKVVEKSSIPWEVFLLNHDMSNVLFISIACSTMISPKLLFNDENNCILLYKIFEDKIFEKNGEKYFSTEWLRQLAKIPSVYQDSSKILVPENELQLFEELDKWVLGK